MAVGRIEADDYMRATKEDGTPEKDIYVAGDTLSYVDEKTGPIPQPLKVLKVLLVQRLLISLLILA